MMKSYFSKTNTGGAIASSGLNFQDNVSLLFLFKYIDDPEFIEMTIESINDFTIIFKNYELSFQVKQNTLNIKLINLLLDNMDFEESKKYVFVGTNLDDGLRNIVNKKFQFQNAMDSGREECEKNKIKEDFKKELAKKKIDFEKIVNITIEEYSINNIDYCIKYLINKWIDNNSYTNVDAELLYDRLLVRISNDLRQNRGSLKRVEVKKIAENCIKLIKTNIKESKDIEYLSKNNLIISIKKDAENIEFIYFRDKILLCKSYIENDNYGEALEIFNSLSRHNSYFTLYCAQIHYELFHYSYVVKICMSVLGKDSKNYNANFYLGISYIKLEKYKKAIDCLLVAIRLNDNAEVNFYIAYAYQCDKRLKNSLIYYKRCIEKENSNALAHLYISSLVPLDEAIMHLDTAITLNPSLHIAYLKKGQILRNISLYEDALDYFYKYIKMTNNEEENILFLSEMALCLYDLGKIDEADNYITRLILKLDGVENFTNLKDGQAMFLADFTWHNFKLIACKKQDGKYKIITPLSEFIFSSNSNDEIFIGLIRERFLSIISRNYLKNGMKCENDFDAIPTIIKMYEKEIDFQIKIKQILDQNVLDLNKEYEIGEEGEELRSTFKEYICKEDKVNIYIKDYNTFKYIRIQFDNECIDCWFSDTGDGYFGFKNKINNPAITKDVFIILGSKETGNEVRIVTKTKNISIKEELIIPRDKYIQDIEIPRWDMQN